jgi:hypothetical protein
MPIRFGGPGVTNTLADLTSNQFALQAGGVWTPPANGYWASLGRYSQLQEYDPIMTIWRPISGVKQNVFFSADGVNQRIANTTGCAVAALLTAGGSGYTSAPLVTPSAGNSVWLALVGGAVNTTVTVAYGGSNYTQPPNVFFSAPPAPGVPATGYATISGGVVTGVTITNQGAGYTYPPTVSFFNDPRDSTGANASAVATLTGAGSVTAILCLNHGNPLTAVPTLTISGGGGSGAAATAIMNFAITAYAVTTAGAGYTAAAGYVWVTATPVPTAGTPAWLNPASQVGQVAMRPAILDAPVSAAGAITATGQLIIDGGSYEAVPAAGSIDIISGSGIVTTAAVLTLTVGGLNDDSNYIYPN